MKIRDWVKFILLSVIWGTSFLWIKIAVEDIGPFYLVLLRIGIALLLVTAYLLFSRTRIQWSWRKVGIFAFIGFFNMALPFVLISWAETIIPSGLASILNSAVPLFTLLFAIFFLPEERPTWQRVVGILIGFAGVVILMSGNTTQNSGASSIPGIVAMLIAAASYGAAVVFARKFAKYLRSEEQSFGQLIMGFAFISIATAAVEPSIRLPSTPLPWIAVVWLGLLGSGVATLLYYSLLNSVGAMKATLVSYVFPIVAVILGVIFLKERPNWQMLLGAVLILGGVVWVNVTSQRMKASLDRQ